MIDPVKRVKDFNNLVRNTSPHTDDNFVLIINLSKDNLNINEEDFAIRFATTIEKVSDWMNGNDLPSIDFRVLVFDWLVEKSTIEFSSIDQLVILIKNADASSAEDFKKIMKLSTLIISFDKKFFAKEFDMSRPSMQRITNGKSAPHPIMRPHIYNWLIEEVNKLLKD